MAAFAQSTAQTAAASFTEMALVSTATVRAMIEHVHLSSVTAPANQSTHHHIARATTAGTLTAVTPEPNDGSASASALTVGVNASAEPTYGTAPAGVLLNIALNQQATYQWWANPGFQLYAKFATTAGINLRCIAVSTAGIGMQSTLMWKE